MSNDNTNPTPPTTPEVAPQTSPAPAPRRRTGLIVAGVATVAILAAGVGAGFAVALSDDDDSTEFSTSSSNGGSVSGETDLDGMLDAASTALTAAEGDVVAIEERTDGTWRVEVQGGGREYEIAVDGSEARIVEEDDDEDGDDLALTADAVRSLVEAATNDTDGRVVQIGSDDNRYSVEVRPSSGRSVELDLDESFQVVGSETDD